MENLDFADMIKALRLLPGNRPIKAKKVESLIEAYKQGVYIPPILVAVPYRFVTEGNHRLGISFNKFVVRLRKKADTWEEPKDSIEAWYLKVAGL